MAVGDDLNRLAAQDFVFLTRALSADASESRAVTEVFRGKLRQAPNGDWVFNASTDQNGVVGFVLGSVAPSWTSSESSTTGIQVTMPFQVSLRVTAAGGLAAVLAVTTEVIVVTTVIPSQFQDAGANSADAALVTSETQQLERDIFALVNQHRMALQLPAFLPDDVCANEARAHSVNMAAGRTPLGHEGFQERISRIAAHGGGGNQAGENTAADQTTAVAVVQGWLSEPDFKRNIEGGSRISGVGVARSNAGTNFFTQIYF